MIPNAPYEPYVQVVHCVHCVHCTRCINCTLYPLQINEIQWIPWIPWIPGILRVTLRISPRPGVGGSENKKPFRKKSGTPQCVCERVRISIGRQEISLRIASPHAAERMPRGAALRPEVADHTPQRGGAEAPS